MKNKVNILITGANGQLGCELKDISYNGTKFNFVFTDKEELDITNFDKLNSFFSTNSFDYCINCAAYTAVDQAEKDRDLADLLNNKAPASLAEVCKKHNAKFIHISTDFVFSGKNNSPYIEEEKTDPVNYYGQSKLNGEMSALMKNDNVVIIRTSWLYSTHGKNFVKSMLKLSENRNELNVIYDQIGTPTYALDLAECILSIINSNQFQPGVYHYSNEGVASWYDFAQAIFETKGLDTKVNPILTEQYPTPAARPIYSVMNKQKIKEVYGLEIPYWKDSLIKCLNKL